VFWQWLFFGSSGAARITGLVVGVAVTLYLRNVHDISNYYAFPTGVGVYLIIRLMWGVLARPRD
jgi:hypothetical protein